MDAPDSATEALQKKFRTTITTILIGFMLGEYLLETEARRVLICIKMRLP